MTSDAINPEQMCELAPDIFRVGTLQHVSGRWAVTFIKPVEKTVPAVRRQRSKTEREPAP